MRPLLVTPLALQDPSKTKTQLCGRYPCQAVCLIECDPRTRIRSDTQVGRLGRKAPSLWPKPTLPAKTLKAEKIADCEILPEMLVLNRLFLRKSVVNLRVSSGVAILKGIKRLAKWGDHPHNKKKDQRNVLTTRSLPFLAFVEKCMPSVLIQDATRQLNLAGFRPGISAADQKLLHEHGIWHSTATSNRVTCIQAGMKSNTKKTSNYVSPCKSVYRPSKRQYTAAGVMEGRTKRLMHGLVKQCCVCFILLWSQNGNFQTLKLSVLNRSFFRSSLMAI